MVWFVVGPGEEGLCCVTVVVKVDTEALLYTVEVRVVALLQKDASAARVVVPRSVTTYVDEADVYTNTLRLRQELEESAL